MKYHLTLATLVAGIYASNLLPEPVVELAERDLNTIQGVIGQVSNQMQALNIAAQNFNGDANSLTSAASNLVNTIRSGTSTIQGTTQLSLNDAASLQSTVGILQTEAQSIAQNLASKKSIIERADLCTTILQESQVLATDAQALISAIVSKVPQEAQGFAENLVGGFTNTLRQNEANFAPGNCNNANGNNGGGGGFGFPTTTSGFGFGFPTTTGGFGFPTSTGGFGFPTTTGFTTRPGSFFPTSTFPFGANPTSRPAQFTGGAVANGVPVAGVFGLLALLF
jgi:hypothetical protein